MYEYGIVKSIHDQRMHQYRIEAERAHLVRQLRKNRQVENGLFGRMMLRLGEVFGPVGAGSKSSQLAT